MLRAISTTMFLLNLILPAHALVCTIKAVADSSTSVEFGVVVQPGKADELFDLITNHKYDEATRCCIACIVPIGTKVLITKKGFPSHTIRILEGKSRGCVGTLSVESVDHCK